MNRFAETWNAGRAGEQSLYVRWLLNPNVAPLRNVELVVTAGCLVEIRPLSDSMADRALPFAVVPPLVNAHTHLEFSGLSQPLLPNHPFTDWIRSVIRHRQQPGRIDCLAADMRKGIQESQQYGISVIGDIVTADMQPTSPQDSSEPPTLPAIVRFRECIGLSADQIDLQLDIATRHVHGARDGDYMAGISPHAPYSVHPELLDALVDLAVHENVPVAMHVAETRDELQLLQHGTGRFRDFLKQYGLWNASLFPSAGSGSPLPLLQNLARAPRALVVHGNYLDSEALEFITATPSLTTVYCPGTHQYFGHSEHPWQTLLRSGAPVALGTDSRASSPDLNLWRELQTAAGEANRPAAEVLLAMVTTHAARALGLPESSHQLRPGQAFNAVLIDCRDDCSSDAGSLLRNGNCQPAARVDDGWITPLPVK